MEEVDRQSVLERDLDSLVDASILQFEIVLVATVSSQIVLEFHGAPSELALIFKVLIPWKRKAHSLIDQHPST